MVSRPTEAVLFTPTGALIGTQSLRQSIEIGCDSHEFNATGLSEILDAQGALSGPDAPTSVGHRME